MHILFDPTFSFPGMYPIDIFSHVQNDFNTNEPNKVIEKLVINIKGKCYGLMIIGFHLPLFKPQVEILTRTCLFLNKGS